MHPKIPAAAPGGVCRLRRAARAAMLATPLLAGPLVATSPEARAGGAGRPIAPTAAHWQSEGNVEFATDADALAPGAALRVNNGDVALRNLDFSDGTIEYDEFDLPGADGMDFPSVRFRAHGAEAAEQVYLRPGPDCPHRDDCIQYAPVLHGSLLWDVYPQYQAGGPVLETGWNHVRIVVAGRRLRAYVNGASDPILAVDELEGDAGAGAIQLNGPALYRNVVVTPGLLTGMPSAARPVAHDEHIVRRWRVSQPRTVPPGVTVSYAGRPGSGAGWSPIGAESAGLVNIGRRYAPPPRGTGAIAWLRTTIVSERARTEPVSIGWSHSITLFVNGRQVFAGDNFYFGLDATRRVPDARLSLRNGSASLPLRRGRNEIVAAVNDVFPGSAVHAGWGLVLQLHDLDGITLAE